jgi:hypothetical protein
LEQELSELVSVLKMRKSQLEEAIAAVQNLQQATGTISIDELENVLNLTRSGRRQAVAKRMRDYYELRRGQTPA